MSESRVSRILKSAESSKQEPSRLASMKELSNQAYERELRKELEKLAEQFSLWRDNQIDTWGLEEAVHKFHNGPARELYKRYTMLSPAEILPYALFKKIIAYEELPVGIADEMKMIASNLYDHN